MRSIFLIICVLLTAATVSGQSLKKLAKDTVVWRADSLLTKEHFQAKRNQVKGAAAYTTTAIWLYQKEVNGNLLFFVDAIMLKSKSFMGDESAYILNHEQRHFDLCEVFARKLRKKIAEKDFTKVRDISSEISRMYTRTMEEYEKEQKKFDSDTEHGINAAKQKLWDDKINEMLRELEPYSNNSVNTVK